MQEAASRITDFVFSILIPVAKVLTAAFTFAIRILPLAALTHQNLRVSEIQHYKFSRISFKKKNLMLHVDKSAEMQMCRTIWNLEHPTCFRHSNLSKLQIIRRMINYHLFRYDTNSFSQTLIC